MLRVWYSTESFADYIIDNTQLRMMCPVKMYMYESDASKPNRFHTIPDHIRKILYLDAPDLIVELNNEPIFTIEITTEAGTGHNAFQRFSRMAASVENGVPALYVYPEGVLVSRQGIQTRWDKINPLIFKAMFEVAAIHQIPALLFYYPSELDCDRFAYIDEQYTTTNKGLRNDIKIDKYSGCPTPLSQHMQNLFLAINTILASIEKLGIVEGRRALSADPLIRAQHSWMHYEYACKSGDKNWKEMSPLSAVKDLPTQYLLTYLSSKFESCDYRIGDLLRQRSQTIFYQADAKFRGDPYPGALAAIDYLMCRSGKTYEDRHKNLVLVFGRVNEDTASGAMYVSSSNGSSIKDFFSAVKNAEHHNLLTRDQCELKNYEIPRYYMQVRYGSTYSKAKHIRVYSYFADAILFPDGSLWRDG